VAEIEAFEKKSRKGRDISIRKFWSFRRIGNPRNPELEVCISCGENVHGRIRAVKEKEGPVDRGLTEILVGIERANSAWEREIRMILKTGRSGAGPAEVGAWVPQVDNTGGF
jgi:hypothetical protein